MGLLGSGMGTRGSRTGIQGSGMGTQGSRSPRQEHRGLGQEHRAFTPLCLDSTAAVIGTRLHVAVAVSCILMAFYVLVVK